MADDFRSLVRQKAQARLLFLPHAVRQMNHPERMIRPAEIEKAVMDGVLIEEYPEDARGHSCLILGYGDEDRPIHVVCAPKDEYLAIITAYLPDVTRWSDDFRTRRST